MRVHTDEGLAGLGETFFMARTVEAYVHEFVAPQLLGRDPLAIDRIARTWSAIVGFRSTGAEVRGNSAFDIALWDLFGKATGQPIAQLLGGFSARSHPHLQHLRRHRLHQGRQGPDARPITGSAPSSDYDDLNAFLNRAGELAAELLAEGITAMKIWPFDHRRGKDARATTSPPPT